MGGLSPPSRLGALGSVVNSPSRPKWNFVQSEYMFERQAGGTYCIEFIEFSR